MKFTIKTKCLLNYVTHAAVPVPPVSPIDGVTAINFKVSEEEIVITGTDGFYGVQKIIHSTSGNSLQIDMEEDSEAIFAIKAEHLTNLLKHAGNDVISFTFGHQNQCVLIECGKAKINLNTFKNEFYLDFSEIKSGTKFEMNSENFKDAITLTAAFLDKKCSRPILRGIHIRTENNQVIFESTNGYSKAMMKQNPEKIQEGLKKDVTIPRKPANTLHKTLPNDCRIICGYNSNKFQIEYDDEDTHTSIVTNILAGDYPDISRVGIKEPTKTLVIDSARFKEVFGRVGILDDPDKMVAMNLKMSEKEVVMSCEDVDIGKIIQRIPRSINGEGENLEKLNNLEKKNLERVKSEGQNLERQNLESSANKEIFWYDGGMFEGLINIKFLRIALQKIKQEKLKILTDDSGRQIEITNENNDEMEIVIATMRRSI